MFEQVELLTTGLAAVIDTALLMTLVERRNWRYVALPIVVLAAAAWLLHAGAFGNLLFYEAAGSWAPHFRWLAMTMMATGLLVIPSALVHGCWRLAVSGLTTQPRPTPWYGLSYVPVILVVPVAGWLAADPLGNFLSLTAPLRTPYGIWLGLVDFVSAVVFYRYSSQPLIPRARQFFTSVALLQAVSGILQTFILVYALSAWPERQPALVLLLILAPAVLALLFAYFVLRFSFMQLMLERSAVYAVIVVGLLLVHTITVGRLSPIVEDRFGLNLRILVGILFIGLVVGYRPLRRRTAEALRYWMGSPVYELRHETRQLAGRISALAGQPPEELLQWFVAQTATAFHVSPLAATVFDGAGQRLFDAVPNNPPPQPTLAAAIAELKQAALACWTPRDPSSDALAALEAAGATLVVRFEQPALSGLIVFGRRARNRDFGEEEINAVVLLVEQLGGALANSLLQAERLAAERRALEREKLATLGLLAGSIAHEVKNPLSSIKTIAGVMAEQLGPASEHAEDLRLILGEIDRLSATTSQLLSFVRPTNGSSQQASLAEILRGTLYVMRHLARERGVQLEVQVPETCPLVEADENALREIFFNLLGNSIEAAAGGSVFVSCWTEDGHMAAEIRDTGPGLPPEVQNRLFEPFVTTRPGGTGLGLYLVGRRVRELHGEIHCSSQPGRGTSFTLKLPLAHEPESPTP